ncbi:ribosome silencing factor [Candidatus Desulforudis audaxviator]|uniref:Ribosomal silencing factor RsfS n=1 Tax=Desulforudis audaxviator (strain MP104C) TaxID=477974 RepID=B1I5R8_DESAP|nr:ribosome silencing factor [Candidatus Desulforudis audaxviator]ACA60359.1 iojap-like protein [Candidatus Desulforudis audaxviator MP104C]AZK60414.1 iojap-like protein [Candidatus Desulforudis audaxviator]
MSLSPRTLVEAAVRAAGEKRGDDILVLDISGLTVLSDYFVLVSGRSTTHVKAIADHIREKLGELGAKAPRLEGYREGLWILLDYRDVVVHVFTQSERDFYNLERLWGDAPVVRLPVTL